MNDPENIPAPASPSRRYRAPASAMQAHLLGIVLQKTDGHTRVTQSKQFTLLGGTEEIHEAVTESMVKTFEDLKRKGRDLSSTHPEELGDLLKKNLPKT
jgi:hypothetical protein